MVAGWGLTENGQSSDHLLYTDLKFVPPNACHKFIPDSSLLIEKFCTVKNNQSEVSVARQGDSGGGLTVVYEGQHYIVGIVSSAVNQVTMFTNISWPTHVRWIENEIRKHDSSYNWTDNKITESCPPSDTLVNNKSVCVGDIVFEDTFSGPLSDKWEHGIFFGNENKNWKFNVYTSDKNNSFTGNGSLVIRPTVYDDDFVTSGTLELKGCTETSSPEFCARTASPGRILPPIATAKIHTGNSFSFMYGELEIRAKLPIGDWLAPVLRLGSKDQYYGEGNSGFIDIAVSRGNSDLWCDGTDNGLGQVEFWVYMGPDNHLIYWNFDLNNVPENWYDHYHNFTVIWKPGNIALKIDNELVGELAPEGKTLCELFTALTKEDCLIYNKGSTFAPFDKEFYLSMSVAAGDTNYFKDGCLNRGKEKPWRNEEPEASLKFWQDKENWLPTWNEDRSSLYIDYVRVTAV